MSTAKDPVEGSKPTEVRLQSNTTSPSPMTTLSPTLTAAGLSDETSSVDNPVALLAREEGALRRTIQRYVRDAATVDDVFQEVSLKVLRRLDTVRDPAAVRGWLFQLARNASLDYLRREDRRKGVSHDVLGDHSATGDLGRSPTEQFLSRERILAVRRALDALPESQREALRLRIDEGLNHEAISERLHVSRQAVEVRLCRGRAALKEQLENIMRGDL